MNQCEPFQRWFGDFGGGFCADDITNYDQEQYAKRLAEYLASPAFEPLFAKMLDLLLPARPLAPQRHELDGGRELYCVENLSWYYNLAGQLALAKLDGKNKLCTAARADEECRIVAGAAKALGMELTLVLSRAQAQDPSFVEEIQALGCHADARTCAKWPDSPYAYALYHCESSPDTYVLVLEANFGNYPYPSLVGLLAGRFGKALFSSAESLPLDGVIVPIVTGTEAVGVFPPWMNAARNVSLMTFERPISEEYHIIDMSTYTLATRSAETEQPNTTLCPALVHWWRTAKVSRYGCDHFKMVDTSPLAAQGLTEDGARSVALALAQTDCKKLLLVEARHG